jgi:hypothetical protein
LVVEKRNFGGGPGLCLWPKFGKLIRDKKKQQTTNFSGEKRLVGEGFVEGFFLVRWKTTMNMAIVGRIL